MDNKISAMYNFHHCTWQDQLHRQAGLFIGIHVAIGRTETAMVAKGNKLEIATCGEPILGFTIRRVTTMNHPIKF